MNGRLATEAVSFAVDKRGQRVRADTTSMRSRKTRAGVLTL